MALHRRALLQAGSAAVALAALGLGFLVQGQRRRDRLQSDPITGDWPALGTGMQWLLPDLVRAQVVVPDRPHDKQETLDPVRRAQIRRLRRFTVTTGSQRLRGGEPAVAARGLRILAIGDSVTFGWGVAAEESWPAQLQAVLAGRGIQAEVINAGVPGLGLPVIGAYLQRVAPALRPDGVVVCRRAAAATADPYSVYTQALERARAALPNARFQVLLPPISRFDRHGLGVYQQEAATLSARLAGVPVLELTEPMRALQGQRGCALVEKAGLLQVVRLDDGRVVAECEASAEEPGLPAEIYALFERDPAVREALFFDDGHPDAAGFAALAPVIADGLQAAGWFA